MRTLLAALSVLLVLPVAGCDTITPEDRPPETRQIGVRVAYRLSVAGNARSVAVTYTNEEGETTVDGVDFSRQGSYTQEVDLVPGTTGTFRITATGIVDAGSLTASVTATRADSGLIVTTDSETATTSTAGEEATVESSVEVAVIEVPVE